MSGLFWIDSPEPDDPATLEYRDRVEEYAYVLDRMRDERWERIWEHRSVKPSAAEPGSGSTRSGASRVSAPTDEGAAPFPPESAAEETQERAA